MVDQFGNARDPCGDGGGSAGHGFHQRHRNAIGIAVGQQHRGQHEHRGPIDSLANILLGQGAGQSYPLRQPGLVDRLLQLVAQGAVADDVATEIDAAFLEHRAGLHQMDEALDRVQSSHADDVGRLAAFCRERQVGRQHAAVDDGQPVVQFAWQTGRELAAVVFGNGDAEVGLRQLAGKVLVVHEDVVRMTGEAPGAADAASQDAGSRAGVGGPVRVQVLRGKALHLGHDGQRAPPADDGFGQFGRPTPETTHEGPQLGCAFQRKLQHLGQCSAQAAGQAAGRVDHPVQQHLRIGLHHRLAVRLERHDADVHALTCQCMDLAHDEGLGPAGEQRDQVQDPKGRLRGRVLAAGRLPCRCVGWQRCSARCRMVFRGRWLLQAHRISLPSDAGCGFAGTRENRTR